MDAHVEIFVLVNTLPVGQLTAYHFIIHFVGDDINKASYMFFVCLHANVSYVYRLYLVTIIDFLIST